MENKSHNLLQALNSSKLLHNKSFNLTRRANASQIKQALCGCVAKLYFHFEKVNLNVEL